MPRFGNLISGACIAFLFACTETQGQPIPEPASFPERPNILLIVADDLGYSDLGVFGSEINTPNLDALAKEGIQLTNFHVATNCSPTRAMLLSGTDSHLAGLGTMAEVMDLETPEYRAYPGYEGYLNFRIAALPELLRDAGYRTYMTGKWHLGLEEHTSPHARGFDKTFVLLEGAAGHFNDMQVVPGTDRSRALFRENGKITRPPDDFYSSRDYAHKLIEYLKGEKNSGKPFFAFLSFTAPHWPLQAPEESIAKYKGVYDEGYEVAFERRLERQKELKLVNKAVDGQPLLPGSKHWQELSDEERKRSARLMEIYAAMVDDMDKYIGDVIRTLKDLGQYGNTFIFFMSDNGADAGNPARLPMFRKLIESCCDNSYANMGNADSFLAYGHEWARVSTVPGKFFKSNTTQGGILSPAIIHYPGTENAGGRYDEFLTVMDVAPTVLSLAGLEHPGTSYRDREVYPLQGSSMTPVLNGVARPIHGKDYTMGWELRNHRALRKQDWKIVMSQPPLGDGQWKLHNLKDDPSESNDLSQVYPGIFETMIQHWEDYAEENGVVLLDNTERR